MSIVAASEAITVLDGSNTESCALIAGAALIFFDHVITFGQEVQLFWGERSFSAWLFFANRMLALSYTVISVWSLVNFDAVTLYGKLRGERSASLTHRNNLRRGYTFANIRRDRWRSTACYAPHTVYGLRCGWKCLHRLHPSVIFCGCIEQDSHMLRLLHLRFSARCRCKVLYIVNAVGETINAIMMLAILWHKLYVHHRLAAVDVLSTRNLSLAALLLRDGTIQLTALLLLSLLGTVLIFLDVSTEDVVGHLRSSLVPILTSRILLNVRDAARSTRGEQSQTPSFVRSQHGLQTQADVENMSFELNILGSTEQAQEIDHSRPRGSIERHEGIAEPRNMADNVAIVGDAHRDVNEEEGMNEVEEETLPDEEDNA
ncbi:uncharacterized protein LAESUDRAFT_503457 [Laetiporus sulphureus 93-53]|uniref:DUF6533 domain-containing protein n=1 Tax=Laetiporus sulphureus 93-53 TaxID=1314785 RepID=A0A165BFK1_9APHY|nr:uncharacterized protein LAESUDRAFT_503457 [Laetiporus sulphureus 93-53]KZT00949.1 hypothetical protein LAESUDRAFT_503457 [Laetiporus sulphureus 93-53]